MNWFSRGVRSAFRNVTRTFALVIILGLSIGLALSMLIAHQAVSQKINNVKSSIDNTISVNPAGVRGFAGGGAPLTTAQLSSVAKLRNVTAIDETLSTRLTSSETNLQSAVAAGFLGRRFADSGGAGFGGFGGSQSFTLPVTLNGTNDPTNLSASSATTGGGTFTLKSGEVYGNDSKADVALVGKNLASKNNLKVGSTFSAYSTTIKVVGIFSTGNKFGNDQLIMPLATVQKISDEPNDITAATVYVNLVSNVGSVTSAIKKLLGSSADVTNSFSQSQTTVSALQNIQTISLYSLVGAAIAGAVIILMTMIMIVRERRREIGVVKAIGSSNIRVAGQFMAEAITLTVVAAVIGILIGVVASNPITQMLVSDSSNSASSTSSVNQTGFGNFSGSRSGFRPRGTGFGGFNRISKNISAVHAVVSWGILADGFVVAIIIALIGSAVATYFIVKVRPAEVMRVE